MRSLAARWEIFDDRHPTSDAELEAWGRTYIPGFQHVLPRVEFNGVRIEPGHSWILNLDRGLYKRGGTHWVAVYAFKHRPLVGYFDGFGMPPPREVTLNSWKQGKGVVRGDVQYQQFSDENCGPRSLAALHFLATSPDDYKAFADLAQEDGQK